MKELTFLAVILLIGLVGYVLYSAGVVKDISDWIVGKFEGIKLPEIKMPEFKTKKDIKYENVNYNDIRKKVDEYKSKSKYYDVSNGSLKGDSVTNSELDYLWNGISKRKRVPCFKCQNADMYSGTQYRNTQFWHCPHCGQSITLTILSADKSGIVAINTGIDKSKIQ